ncbi:unnamed protein product, partial [Heterobilharzia americana]
FSGGAVMVCFILASVSRKSRSVSHSFHQISKYFSTLPEVKDYYAVLKVKTTASQDEIKAAYLDLSKKYHPDRCIDEGSKIHFTEISEAYSVLGRPESRQEYDTNMKISTFGVGSSAFRLNYPKPPPDLDKAGLRAYENEMRSFLHYRCIYIHSEKFIMC